MVALLQLISLFGVAGLLFLRPLCVTHMPLPGSRGGTLCRLCYQATASQ